MPSRRNIGRDRSWHGAHRRHNYTTSRSHAERLCPHQVGRVYWSRIRVRGDRIIDRKNQSDEGAPDIRYGYGRVCQCGECAAFPAPARKPQMGKHGRPIAWRGFWYHRMPAGHYRHARGKMLHREIYEAHFGAIPPGMDIHHVDGDPGNNEPSNLEAVSRSEHVREHGPERYAGYAAAPKIGKCSVCGEETKSVGTKPSSYCSHRCYMRAYRAEKPRAPLIAFTCKRCGATGEAKRKRQFCSRRCKNNHHVAEHARRKRAGL